MSLEGNNGNPLDIREHAAQAAGGITGVLAGAAIGTVAGPIGIVLGGIAGAIGGWWSGRAIVEAARDITPADESHYLTHVRRAATRVMPDGDDDDLEEHGAFYLGHIAAANPAYADRPFEEVEADLERGWRDSATTQRDWQQVRDCCRAGYARGRERRRQPRDTPDRRVSRS